MCLIVLAIDQHPEIPLVLATNRDEVHDRPTEPMKWWEDQPILAGRDKRSGGTWLAIQRNGSMALVTNYRSGTAEIGKRSRGNIPLELLQADVTSASLTTLFFQREMYSGFNLIASNGSRWFYTGSEDRVPYRDLSRGLYGLSNHLLQSNWPKVNRGRAALRGSMDAAAGDTAMLHDLLIQALKDETPAEDALLPDTGVGLELERFLSPLFIRGSAYGTRATTVVTVERSGKLKVSEQQYGPAGSKGERRSFSWQTPLEAPEHGTTANLV